MTTKSSIRKTIGALALAGALAITAMPGGIAHADGDSDGRDFLVWQGQFGPVAGVSAGDLADWQANYGAESQAAGALDPEYKYVPVRR